ncbi:MAG: hypothetical protein RIR90_485 [Bacteroidota bacterium]|jgi:2-polyprenyl-3-methyl-5-hydroxy-6-metoxy-1,4-benzoquinol methylase
MQTEQSILDSWQVNAAPWSKAIADKAIESRQLVTNAAIVQAITQLQPASVLDLGCGEGWLSRALKAELPQANIKGVDAIPALIDSAKNLSTAIDYAVASYQDIIAGALHDALYNLIAINFALFGDELVRDLLQTLRKHITEGGHLVIQTLHPVVACGDLPYQSGWREGSWAGFSSDFKDAHPWYFRTLEDWLALFLHCGYRIQSMQEPLHPKTGKPASVIFTLKN